MSESGRQQIIPVFVVVPPRALLLDIAGPLEVLRRANMEQTAVRFSVTYVGPSPDICSSVGLGLTGIRELPRELPDGSLVVVSGAVDEPLGAMTDTRPADAVLEGKIIRWLEQVVGNHVRLATICSGALLAARAGLLEGHECTTHHSLLQDLVRLAPTARVRENRLYVEDGLRLTSAGVTAGIDLMLAVVARDVSHATALAVARNLVVYLRRAGADPQLSPWLEGRNHIHPAIHRAQDAVSADPSRNWAVETLAYVAATSPRNLSRLFSEHTGMSVSEYVNRIRVALARQLITGSRLDMESVAERVGFSSARQLRRAWHKLHGASPTHARTGT